MEAFTAGRVLEMYDQNLTDLSASDVLAGDIPMQAVETFRGALQQFGLDNFLADGRFTVEEALVTFAEVGKAVAAKDPENFAPEQETVQAAGGVLERHGVDDPDGTLAQGLAVSAAWSAAQFNQWNHVEPAAQASAPEQSGIENTAPQAPAPRGPSL